MILSFIDIEDFKSPGFPEKNEELRDSSETTEETDKLISSETKEHAAKDDSSGAENSSEANRNEQGNEGLRNINYSSQFFGDTFELRYLQHKEKIEKERFARELLAGGQ